MGYVKIENIGGYQIGEEVVCTNCVNNAEIDNIKETDIITLPDNDQEDDMCFCDRCKKKIY